ncbi:MAG: hypothetical protein ACRDTJ_02530 [Pseudonocardiaceae bacterium]
MKTPDELSGTDEQQAEYAARALHTIRADALADSHLGRLVSLAGHPPRRLVDRYPTRDTVVLCWDALTSTAVTADTELTIHPEA